MCFWRHELPLKRFGPQFHRNAANLRIRTVAAQSNAVTTTGGIRIQPDLTLDKLSETKRVMLILPGGSTWDEGKNMETVEAARAVLASDSALYHDEPAVTDGPVITALATAAIDFALQIFRYLDLYSPAVLAANA